MRSRLQEILCCLFFVSLAILWAESLPAQVATPADSAGTPGGAPMTPAMIHGQVVDPSGARIPGAKITATDVAGGNTTSATSDALGNFQIKNLTPGDYLIEALAAGFAPFESTTITVAAGQAKRVDIVMAVAVAQQNIVVSDEAPEVNVEAGGNVSAVVLKGSDLGALSDDPDELANELAALAGPSAGPNGGEIYIDGFSGGELPPKTAILEIRINQNPFSAEYDRLGYGRTEILTKPGTEKRTVSSIYRATTSRSIPAIRSQRTFLRITATNSTGH